MCQCPVVKGVQYAGDGYMSCKRKLFYLVSHPVRLEVSPCKQLQGYSVSSFVL